MRSHVHAHESISNRIGLRSLAGWMNRSLDAMRAELEPVDCGSLDVLLYCADDVAASALGDLEVDHLR